MANKRIKDLPEATSSTTGDVVAIDGTTTQKITVENLLGENLDSIKGLTSAADKGIQFTASDGSTATYDLTAAGKALLDDADAAAQLTTLGVSAFVKTLLDDADASAALTTLGVSTYIKTLLDDSNAAAARGTLGVVIGTDVQAQNAHLADIAGASLAQGDLLYYNGTNLVRLPAGTAGNFLKTQGTGANPAWASVPGGGDMLAANNLDDVADPTTALANLPVEAMTPTWTGIHKFDADAYFKSGRPWADVRAWGAVGDGSTDDSTAVQDAIDYMDTTFGGGIVYVPPGNYYIPSGIVIPMGVWVIGAGREATVLQSWHTDNANVVTIDSDAHHAGIEKLTIYGKGINQDTGTFGANHVALVVAGVENVVRDVMVGGGLWAIEVPGVDNYFENVNSLGQSYGAANVFSSGANWYVRCKFDFEPTGVPTIDDTRGAWAANTAYATGKVVQVGDYYIQATAGGTSGSSAPTLKNFLVNMTDGTVTWQLFSNANYRGLDIEDPGNDALMETHCDQCDFSGKYVQSLFVNYVNSIVVIKGSVFSSPIHIPTTKWTALIGNEFGSTGLSGNDGVLTITDSYAFAPTTFAGTMTVRAGDNYNIDTGQPAAFRANNNGTNQTGIANQTFTKLTLTNEVFDRGGYYDAANSKWTPPAGMVSLFAAAYIGGGATASSEIGISITKNGTRYADYFTAAEGSGGTGGATLSTIDQANGTDYYEVQVYATTGSTATVAGNINLTHFSGIHHG